MKKALIIMLLISLLSMGGAIAVSATIWDSADDIVFTEEVEYGDKGVVEGATVELRFHASNGWGWITEHTLGEAQSTRTQVISNWDYPEYDKLPYTNFKDSSLSENEAAFARVIAKVAGSKNAQANPESVREDTNMYGIYAREIRCSYRSKDKLGNVQVGDIYLYVKKIENTLYFRITHSLYGTDYYKVEEETGFWGLYACDINPENNEPKPETVREIDLGERKQLVKSMYFDYDENKILVVAEEETENAYLSVIDVATETQVQEIVLGDREVCECVEYGDFMVLITAPREFMLFSKDESGHYHKEFEQQLQMECFNGYELSIYDKAFDWDGERLIMAGMRRGGLENQCGMFVSVFDETGLLYHAEYKNSVDIGEGDCYPDSDPITVRWK
ncbi:MAG: hypothetical protein J6B96_08405 [Agathobacter sp.]|nr:hypothetical protein [Agathobacter sp.]